MQVHLECELSPHALLYAFCFQDHPIPTITVIDENQQLVTQIQPQQPSSSSLSQPQQQQQSQSGAAAAKPTAAAAPAVTTSTSAAWQADSTRVCVLIITAQNEKIRSMTYIGKKPNIYDCDENGKEMASP